MLTFKVSVPAEVAHALLHATNPDANLADVLHEVEQAAHALLHAAAAAGLAVHDGEAVVEVVREFASGGVTQVLESLTLCPNCGCVKSAAPEAAGECASCDQFCEAMASGRF
jgi:hypothetical protein